MILPGLRSRVAALVLLVASPGTTGLAVDAAHPCPEKAPWTVDQDSHHHDEFPAQQHDCRCVGTCLSAAGSLSPAADDVLLIASPLERLQPGRLHLEVVLVGRPRDRLPPSTAPPLL